MSQFAVPLTRRIPASAWAVALVSSVAALALGWALVAKPLLAYLPITLMLLVPLLVSGRARVLVVVFGTLFVFQTSDELTASKLFMLLAVTVAFGAVLVRLPQLAKEPAFDMLVPMLRSSVVFIALATISLPVALLNDASKKDWLRDVAPYLLFAAAPVFALDAQASFSRTGLRRLLVVAGTIGASAFAIRWLTNRGIADLGYIPVGVASLLLAASVFAYGIAMLLHSHRRRLRWVALVSVVFAMLASTGTRTVLILLAAPLAVVVGAREHITRRYVRLLVVLPVATLLAYTGTVAVTRITDADRDVLSQRVSLLFSTADTSADRSYIDRLAQTRASWELFTAAPLMGQGPGLQIRWTDSLGVPMAPLTVDSPLSFLAKFGILGLAALTFAVGSTLATVRRMRVRLRHTSPTQLALAGWGAVVVAWSLLQNPFDDKGFAIALVLLLATAAREAADADTSTMSAPSRDQAPP